MLPVRLELLVGDQKHSLGRGMGVVEGWAGGPVWNRGVREGLAEQGQVSSGLHEMRKATAGPEALRLPGTGRVSEVCGLCCPFPTSLRGSRCGGLPVPGPWRPVQPSPEVPCGAYCWTPDLCCPECWPLATCGCLNGIKMGILASQCHWPHSSAQQPHVASVCHMRRLGFACSRHCGALCCPALV